MDFQEAVYEVVKKIPAGRVLSYSKVAERAGYPGASRAVGRSLAKNYDPAVPCHRVVRKNGRPGGYNRGVEEKIKKLKREGYGRFSRAG